MLKKAILIVLFVALGTAFGLSANAQTNTSLPQIFGSKQADENKIYQDENGTYHYETREKRVWVPEQQSTGIFGTRVVPGHYETVREQVKVYTNRNNGNNSDGGYYDQNGVYHPGNGNGGYYDQNGVYHPGNGGYTNPAGKSPGWVGKHPHGMPPGQRKKMGNNGNYDNSQYPPRNKTNREDD